MSTLLESTSTLNKQNDSTATLDHGILNGIISLSQGLHESYNIDSVACLAAAIEAQKYVVTHMQNAQRFDSAAALHLFATSQTPQTGMILEFGVFSGQSINHIAAQFTERTVFGFDSFEGLPETWRAGFEKGAFKTNLPAVRNNVRLVVGWFDKSLPNFVVDHPTEPLALLHVDSDLYSSAKTIFEYLSARIVVGTVIVFDEYFNYPQWQVHEYQAWQEFVASRAVEYEYVGFVPSHQQVAVKVTSIV